MNKLLLLSFLLLGFTAFNQGTDYIVDLDGDTTYCKIDIRNTKKIIATTKNQEIKYTPEEIRGFGFGEKYYEAGRFSIPAKYGIRSWAFEERLIAGEMSLFVMYTSNTSTNSATQEMSVSHTPTFHVKMKSDERDDYEMLTVGWKKKLGKKDGCSAFTKKLGEAGRLDYNGEFLFDLVTIYNNCGK